MNFDVAKLGYLYVMWGKLLFRKGKNLVNPIISWQLYA
jgi:hypothetical protein